MKRRRIALVAAVVGLLFLAAAWWLKYSIEGLD